MKPIVKSILDWTDEERRQVRADALFSGHDVTESEDEMIIAKAKPMVRHKPKERFFR